MCIANSSGGGINVADTMLKAETRIREVKSFVEKEILQAELEINGYKMDRECLMDYDVEIETLQTYKQKLETILRMLSEV